MIVSCTRALPHHTIGGMPEVVWYQAVTWAQAGYPVTVLTTPIPGKPHVFMDQGVNICCVGHCSLSYGGGYYDGTESWLRSHKSDVSCVISHSRAGTRGKDIGLPTVFVDHGGHINHLASYCHAYARGESSYEVFSRNMHKLLDELWHICVPDLRMSDRDWLSSFNATVVLSPTHELWLRQFEGVDNTVVIPNFVPDIQYDDDVDVDATFIAVDLKASNKNIPRIAKMIHDKNERIRFVGKNPPFTGHRVSVVPPCAPLDVGRWIHKSKIFVDPSTHFSGLNTTLLWAACQSRMSIAYDLPGTDYIVPRKYTVPLLGNKALWDIWEQSLAEWKLAGKESRKIYEREFSPSVWLRRWDKLFNQIGVKIKR